MARNQLHRYRIQLQKTLTALNRLDTLTNILLPNSEALIYDTDQTRHRTLLALASQYQRMMQAAPLTRTGLNPRFTEPQLEPIGYPARPDPLPNMQPRPLGSVAQFCNGALEFSGSGGKWQCSNCSFQASEHGFGNGVCHLPTKDGPRLHLHAWVILKSHLRLRRNHDGGDFPLYGCKLCPQAGRFTESNLKQHLQQHTSHQLKGRFGRSVQVCDCRARHGRDKKSCAVVRLLLATVT